MPRSVRTSPRRCAATPFFKLILTHNYLRWTLSGKMMVSGVLTPKVLHTIAWGCLLLATPGSHRDASPPRVAAEKTRQPWAMVHNAFGVDSVQQGEIWNMISPGGEGEQ